MRRGVQHPVELRQRVVQVGDHEAAHDESHPIPFAQLHNSCRDDPSGKTVVALNEKRANR
jgi:hypothetical protein